MHQGGTLRITTAQVDFDDDYCKHWACIRTSGKICQALPVSDTGTGMDSETMKHIFRAILYDKRNWTRGPDSALATTFAIVKQHSGSVETESELGKGTTFNVYLPAFEGPAQPRLVLDETPAQRGTETILVAEDNDGVLDLIKDVLTSLGYKTIVARDGAEAISEFKLHSDKISLVLLDMQMPKATGHEVYEAIRRIKSGVPVILTSGYVESETELLLSTSSKVALLPKPFSPMSLGHKVRELLDQRVK